MKPNEHTTSAVPTRDRTAYAIGPKLTNRTDAGRTSDVRRLRQMAREAIDAGDLPDRRADRTWGGRSTGARCAVCGSPVAHDEPEIELEFTGDDRSVQSSFHVHVPCLAAWEFEVDRITPAVSDSRTA